MTPAWYLVIFFCVASADGQTCGARLVPEPLPTPLQCQVTALALIQSGIGYRPPFTCTSKRPDDLPLAPAPVQPERWAARVEIGIPGTA